MAITVKSTVRKARLNITDWPEEDQLLYINRGVPCGWNGGGRDEFSRIVSQAKEIKDKQLWKLAVDDDGIGIMSWEEYCNVKIKESPETVNILILGYEVLYKRGDKVEEATREFLERTGLMETMRRAKDAKNLEKHGTNRYTVEDRAKEAQDMQVPGRMARDDNIRSSQYGTNTDYLNARLKRDHHDIYEKLCNGEYPSTRAAAIEAGIVKDKIQCNASVQSVVNAIKKKFSNDDINKIIDQLGEP